MSVLRRTLLVFSATALSIAAQTASASAVSVHPMSFDECGTNGDKAYNCMYISGGGNMATEVRGWSTPGPILQAEGRIVHEEVVYPNGTALCNSPSYTITSPTQVISCQLSPGGSFPIPTGQYCAILWGWFDINGLEGYEKEAENCGTVSA